MPVLYYVNMPTKEHVGPLTGQSREALLSYHRNQYQIAHLNHMDSQMAELIQRKQVDKEIQNIWGNMEKETLKKYMLIYGYGRWVKIRSFSASQCKIL